MTCEKCNCPKCAKFQVEGTHCSCRDCGSGEYIEKCSGFIPKEKESAKK